MFLLFISIYQLFFKWLPVISVFVVKS